MMNLQGIPMTTARLFWKEPLQGPPKSHLLRGAVAAHFPGEPLVHQHGNKGFVYRYPLIQYRWQHGNGVLVGFHEGATFLAQVPFLDLTLQLGADTVGIAEVNLDCKSVGVSVSDRLLRYRFITPWLPFNQETYRLYEVLNITEKTIERDRLAVANILMMLKGLGIMFSHRLYAVVEVRKTVWCQYKDQKMLGVLGSLITNADLPDGVAIGRAVSHGYGWIERTF